MEDRQLFDGIAKHYVRKDLTSYCRIARKLRLERTLKNIGKPIHSLLEVGCGTGFTAEYLKGSYEKYVGLDYSDELIRYAREHNSFHGVQFVCDNVRQFDCKEKFQVILLIGVLHHIPEAEEVLVRLKALLETDGVLVVNEPQKGNPLIGLLRRVRKRLDPAYSSDQVEFSERDLMGLFSRSGYQVKTFSQGVFSTPLAETRIFPESIGIVLANFFAILDPLLERLLSLPILRNLSWNVVVEGRVSPRLEEVRPDNLA